MQDQLHAEQNRTVSDLLRTARTSFLDIIMVKEDPGFKEASRYPRYKGPEMRPEAPASLPAPNVRVPRLAVLSGPAALKLYTAVSLLLWRYDRCFNTQVTINPGSMGIPDHEFGMALSAWNKAAGKFLGRPLDSEHRRRRCRRRMLAEPQRHLWIYVLEQTTTYGLHAHELCVVPPAMRKGFVAHTRQWWSKRARQTLSSEALKITVGYDKGDGAVRAHYERTRYILKSVCRTAALVTKDGDIPLTKVFKTEPYHAPDPKGVSVAQLYGLCRELRATEANRRVDLGTQKIRYQSALETGSYQAVYSGWEHKAVEEERKIEAVQDIIKTLMV